MADLFDTHARGIMSPAPEGLVITPDDDTDLANIPRAIRVGGAGDLTVIMSGNGQSVLISGVLAGEWLIIRPSRIMSTGTTATNIACFW